MCGCLSCAPLLGTWPATQACALTGNRTSEPFGSQANTQSTEPHQPGLIDFSEKICMGENVHFPIVCFWDQVGRRTQMSVNLRQSKRDRGSNDVVSVTCAGRLPRDLVSVSKASLRSRVSELGWRN